MALNFQIPYKQSEPLIFRVSADQTVYYEVSRYFAPL